ncbi:lysophospholipase [Alcaligenaceae bacterium LF4-65]|uniref:Lysophospholipase n=1 Tax=Zwartia hollandica TaxID=324606 RepID=A0A953T6D3_9BURK|nr:lysophospholipase [Zwartia hollandica]MBZ1349699.1 lysophospholipase [Zwartia hollandica]
MQFVAMVNFYSTTSVQRGFKFASPLTFVYLVPLFFTFVLIIFAQSTQAQGCASLAQDRSIADGKGCLTVWSPVTHAATGKDEQSQVSPPILVVLLHGDSGGGLAQRHLDRWTKTANILSGQNQTLVFLVRPGYRSPVGDSSGWANQHDDDYTAGNVERVATALQNLRVRYNASKVIVVGHSGGAAITALLLGRFPSSLDGAILLGCPCDVPPWRQHRGAQRGRQTPWPNSLNPMDAVANIPTDKVVLAVTGSLDDNTLPLFAQAWINAVSARGVNARFILAPDLDHTNILLWPGLSEQLRQTINNLSSRAP